MKLALSLLSAILLMSLLEAGAETGEGTPDRHSEAINCFSLEMYKKLAKTSEDNIFSSPFSVDVILSLLLTAARGNTAAELRDALGYNDIPLEDLKELFKKKLEILKEDQDQNPLLVANSLWVDDSFSVKESFQSLSRRYFNAEEQKVDFRKMPSLATKRINLWVNESTNGMIPKLFDKDVDDYTEMIIANAMFFNGTWEHKFKERNTEKQNFFNRGDLNSKSESEMMHQIGKFYLKEDETLKADVLEMDYVGNKLSMVIILPHENWEITNLEGKLNCNNFLDVLSPGENILVNVTVPKFAVNSNFDLNEVLKDMGIVSIFDQRADLSGMSESVYLSKVIQKAKMIMDEDGSRAAVATAAIFSFKSYIVYKNPPPIFRADHPFIFLIRDKRTNLVLFMGRINEFS